MILRGVQIHRHGHGQCGLLPNPTLSSNNAQLLSTGVPANTGTNLFNRTSLLATPTGRCSLCFDCRERKPFHLTRARYRLMRTRRA